MTNPINQLYNITKKNLKSASITLAKSFFRDPLISFYFPNEHTRMDYLMKYECFRINYGLTYGIVNAPSKRIEGIAVWLPNTKADFHTFDAIKLGAWKFLFQFGLRVVSKFESLSHFSTQLRSQYINFDYWYLSPIGVDPDYQHQGYAKMLLQPMFERFDKTYVHCVLETQSLLNFQLYTKFGFEIIKETIFPDANLLYYLMVRKPHRCP